MLEKTLHFLETAAIFHSEPAYNLPCFNVKKRTKISFLSAAETKARIRPPFKSYLRIFNLYFFRSPLRWCDENLAPNIRLFSGSMLKFSAVLKSAFSSRVLKKIVPLKSQLLNSAEVKSASVKSVSINLQSLNEVVFNFSLKNEEKLRRQF